MNIGFLVNERRELGVEQTTTLMMAAAVRRRHRVCVFGVADLNLDADGRVLASGCVADEAAPAALVEQLFVAPTVPCALDDHDLAIIRTNPGRDEAHLSRHLAALRVLERAFEQGLPVVNSPRGLWRALTKLSLFELPPELRPRTLVTRDFVAIQEFVKMHGRTVIKPLDGTRGRDVFVLEADRPSSNTHQIVDVILRQGYAVVQEFVPGAEHGDVRVTVVGGKVLEVSGHAAAVARVPGRHDFRSNLHAGGSAKAAVVSGEMRDAVAQIAPMLEREGLFHVGVDFIGNRILELNVFSPGGLHPGERLYGVDFCSAVIESLENRYPSS